MIYKVIKGTDYRVSAVAMGSALFGATYSEKFAFEQLDIFTQNGGNFIDTAHVYNDWIPGERSRSEKVIGRWLTQNNMHDSSIVLTKGAHPPMTDMGHSRVNRDDIRTDVYESLENLQKSRLDLYLLHRDDICKPVSEIVGWMNELVNEGLIRYWGCSNWTTRRMIEANIYAKANDLASMVCNQTMWSLASIHKDKLADQTLVPLDQAGYAYHQDTGLSLMAFISQAKGYFPRLAAGEVLPKDIIDVYGSSSNKRKLLLLKQMSTKTGLSLTELSLIFFLNHPFTAIPIVAYDNNELLRSGLRAYRPEVETLMPELSFPLEF